MNELYLGNEEYIQGLALKIGSSLTRITQSPEWDSIKKVKDYTRTILTTKLQQVTKEYDNPNMIHKVMRFHGSLDGLDALFYDIEMIIETYKDIIEKEKYKPERTEE